MELAHLPYKKGRSYEDYLGLAGLKRLGKKKWRLQVSNLLYRRFPIGRRGKLEARETYIRSAG